MSVRNSLRSASEFLALRRNTSLLLVALLLAGTGEKLWLGFAPKYIETLGGSILIIGLFDALQTFLGAIYAYPGGWLTDHWGQRKSLLLFSAISIAGYLLVLFWQSWLALLLGSFLFLAWSALSLPATFSVIATSLKSNRHTMGVGVQSMIRRVPMMLGPLIGGWLINHFSWTDGVRYALALCITMSLLTVAFQWFMFEPESSAGVPPAQDRRDACPTFLHRRQILYARTERASGERHPHPLLRTNSVCLHHFVGDGFRRPDGAAIQLSRCV